MNRFLLTFLIFIFSLSLLAQDKKAYVLYDKDGNKTTYASMLQEALKHDIILFGELHNNAISHWLQLELSSDLYNSIGKRLIMGAEMFESDNQLILNEYLSGLINTRNFTSEAKLWRNYSTDIEPLVHFAKNNELNFVATNIPRRYASIVNHHGFDGLDKLSDEAKYYIAPLPIAYDPELPGYSKMLEMAAQMPGHQTSENFPKAQAIKDATMSYFILEHMINEAIFIHFHGAFHSDFYDGIYWYLNQSQKDFKVLTISTVEQQEVQSLNEEHIGKADFIICVPASMTKTH